MHDSVWIRETRHAHHASIIAITLYHVQILVWYLNTHACIYIRIRTWSKCDRLWENPAYGIFYENRVWCIFDNLYHRANPCSGFRLIVCFAVELHRFLSDRTTPPKIDKLQSKSVAMHLYGVSVYYYVYTRSHLNGPGWSRSKWKQRSSEGPISTSITRATSSMPKKLKRLVNVR